MAEYKEFVDNNGRRGGLVLPMPGSPELVTLTVPVELIDFAVRYPATDWNDVMRRAVETYSRFSTRSPLPSDG